MYNDHFSCRMIPTSSGIRDPSTINLLISHLQDLAKVLQEIQLNVQLSDQAMELNHMNKPKSETKSTNKFECTICSKSFARASNLKDHILNMHIDDKDKTFQCTVCLETKQLVKCFGAERILNKHIKRAHNPSNFKCQVCLKTFKCASKLASHKLMHSQINIKKYKCHLCDKTFPVNDRLQCHLFLIHKLKLENRKYFKCELCSREFLGRATLETHVVNYHVVDKAFECLVCSLKFINQETLKKHLKNHDRPRSHICDICSKGFMEKRSLISHLGRIHNHFFFCYNCLTSFRNKSDFDQHIICNPNQELKCSLCQTLIESECNLKTHTASHVDEIKTDKNYNNNVEKQTKVNELNKLESTNLEKFECQLCSKTFDREEYFRIHRKLIHPNVEWKCNFDQCTKSFKQYSLLKYHQMDHFKCPQCPKSYVKASALNLHIAMEHGGPKLFKCPEVDCGTS